MARIESISVPSMENNSSINKRFIIGIDPGRNGGIVGLTNGHVNVIDKMPQQLTDLWGYFVDVLAVPVIGKENINVFIEDVHSMPTDGVRSAFQFGRHLGHLDMVLCRYDLAVTRVLPHKWMEFYDLFRGKGETKYGYKKRIVEEAQRLANNSLRPKITLATADAYLIARYGWEMLKSSAV